MLLLLWVRDIVIVKLDFKIIRLLYVRLLLWLAKVLIDLSRYCLVNDGPVRGSHLNLMDDFSSGFPGTHTLADLKVTEYFNSFQDDDYDACKASCQSLSTTRSSAPSLQRYYMRTCTSLLRKF